MGTSRCVSENLYTHIHTEKIKLPRVYVNSRVYLRRKSIEFVVTYVHNTLSLSCRRARVSSLLNRTQLVLRNAATLGDPLRRFLLFPTGRHYCDQGSMFGRRILISRGRQLGSKKDTESVGGRLIRFPHRAFRLLLLFLED